MRGERSREAALEDLYQGLSTLTRRARDLGDDLHPGLSLVAYTLLVQIDLTSEARAADLAAHFGLDKSTVSRQLEQLIAAGLLRREGERPGRRGYALVLTDAGNSCWPRPLRPSGIASPGGWPTGTTVTWPPSASWWSPSWHELGYQRASAGRAG